MTVVDQLDAIAEVMADGTAMTSAEVVQELRRRGKGGDLDVPRVAYLLAGAKDRFEHVLGGPRKGVYRRRN